MSGIEVGAVCYKTVGKNAGKRVVVLEVNKKALTAVIEGKGLKKKKCNLRHLFFTGEMAEKSKAGKKQGL